mgnify:CR=1 FL=1
MKRPKKASKAPPLPVADPSPPADDPINIVIGTDQGDEPLVAAEPSKAEFSPVYEPGKNLVEDFLAHPDGKKALEEIAEKDPDALVRRHVDPTKGFTLADASEIVEAAGVPDEFADKTAEMLVDLRKMAGMKPSNRGFYHASPDRNRFEQVLDFYGLKELGKRIPSA